MSVSRTIAVWVRRIGAISALLALWLVLVGCGRGAVEPLEVRVSDGALEVTAPFPAARVDVLDARGQSRLVRRLPAPSTQVRVELPDEAGPGWQVRVHTRRGPMKADLPMPPPGLTGARVFLEAPLGQGRQALSGDERIEVALVDGTPVQAALVVIPTATAPVRLMLGDETLQVEEPRPGERIVLLAHIDQDMEGRVLVGEEKLQFAVGTQVLPAETARQRLSLLGTVFPAEQSGQPDLARPRGRVTLAAGWWEVVLRETPLGFRPRDVEIPWGYQAVELHNSGDEGLSVVLRSRVVGPDGEPAQPFLPRLREVPAEGGWVQALFRVPARSQATATLPVFVADELLSGEADTVFTQVVEVVPLGSLEPLHRTERPLYVSRGSTWTSAGLALALLGALGGLGYSVRRMPHWLSTRPTTELVTIALFGSLTFATSAVSQLLAMGVAALLGPFAMLVTGLLDDAVRIALLATLVTLSPRPGTITLAVWLSWLLRGLALGSLNPTDLLFVGARVAWLEGLLYLAGLTRSDRWRRSSRVSRWLRLSVGFGLASVLSGATGLVLSAVLYRLYYASWYVFLVLLGPGFVYVVVACWPATSFAESLRRVEP